MIYFDKDCEPANDIVVLNIIDNDILSSKNSGFVIDDESLRNLRVGFAQILKIGSKAKEETGLEPGAYVYYDKLATFYHTEPIGLVRYNALIMETNKEHTSYKAMADRVIVQEVKKEESSSGFIIQNSNELKIGIIKSITEKKCNCNSDSKCQNCNCKSSQFKIGDKILLTKEDCDTLHGFTGDSSLDPTLPILIYKTTSILCKINED